MKKIMNFMGIALCGAALLFSSCSKDDTTTDPNAGKTDPSTIASANLVAYWGFENKATDAIGQRGTATSSVTYTTGRRGLAFQGAQNAYISWDLPLTDKLATLKSFTAAMWVKAPKVPAGKGIPAFFQLSGAAWEGALSIFQDNVGNNLGDSLHFKGFFGKAGVPWVGHWWNKASKNIPADRWLHMIIKYDATSSIATLYVNGTGYKYETLGAYDSSVRYQNDPGSAANVNGATKLGDLNLPLRASGNKGIIGYWALKAFFGGTDDWQGYFYGQLDEMRIYDKALSDLEIQSLYAAELTQIN